MPTWTLQQVTQDPDTGAWHEDGERIDVAAEVFRSTFVEVPWEPRRDPRITRLAELVSALLAEFENVTGRPATAAEELAAAMAAVEAIPEEEKRRRHAAARMATQMGFDRGKAAGRG